MENLEDRTIRKVSARLIPFLMICYFIAYLDRVNVGFAALTMNKSLGLTAFTPQIAQATGLGNAATFYVVRLLLGAAEAGFFPGIIFFLTLWYPSAYRGRIISAFMAAIPLSSAIGSPISGMILGMDGIWGLEGWQWLFIIEAAPAIVLAVATYLFLTARPAGA